MAFSDIFKDIGIDLNDEQTEGEKLSLEMRIIRLLHQRKSKMSTSDIDGFLRYRNVDKVKETCEQLYFSGTIQRTANYRYYILNDISNIGVMLLSAGDSIIRVIKVVREHTNMGLKEAKELVDSAPIIIPTVESNHGFIRDLEHAGAKITLIGDNKGDDHDGDHDDTKVKKESISLKEQITEIKDLFDDGLITEEEFDIKRKKILNI